MYLHTPNYFTIRLLIVFFYRIPRSLFLYGSASTLTNIVFSFSTFSIRTVPALHDRHFKVLSVRFTHDSVVLSSTLLVYYSIVLVCFLGMSASSHILIDNFYSMNSPLL